MQLDNVYKTITKDILPADPLLFHESTSEKTTESGSTANQGITPGASEDQAPPTRAEPTNTSKDKTRARDWIQKIGIEKTGKLSPDIVRITCAVIIDENDADSASRVEDIREVVMPITGITNRQDITVKVFPFPEPEPIAAPVGPGFMGLVREWGPTAGQVLGVLLVLLFLRGMLKRADRVKGDTGATGAGDVEDELDPKTASRQIRREIEKTISEDPAAISRLLESWLDEQKV